MTTDEEIWEIAMDAENDSEIIFRKINKLIQQARADERAKMSVAGAVNVNVQLLQNKEGIKELSELGLINLEAVASVAEQRGYKQGQAELIKELQEILGKSEKIAKQEADCGMWLLSQTVKDTIKKASESLGEKNHLIAHVKGGANPKPEIQESCGSPVPRASRKEPKKVKP